MGFKIEGVFPPHITPFKKNGDLDEELLKNLVDFWIGKGVSGLVTCGSNGEAPYLSREERKQVLKVVLDSTNNRVPLIAGVGSMSTRETLKFTKDAEDMGVQAVLVVTPFYFPLSEEEIFYHYDLIIRKTEIPIILYNVPKFTGYSISPRLVSRLVEEHSQIAGIKDSSGNLSQISEIIRLTKNKISMLAGTTDTFLPTLMLGGNGAILASANVAPRLCQKLFEAFKKGEYSLAADIQFRLSLLNDTIVRKYNQISAIKYALTILSKTPSYPRKPVLPLKVENREEIRKVLKKLQLI